MEALVAIAIGTLTASGIYLMLRQRTFPVIIGLTLVSYAVNVFIFAAGRLVPGRPHHRQGCGGLYRPAAAGTGADGHRHLLRDDSGDRDDVLGAWLESGHDKVDMDDETDEQETRA
jgi:multicomponent K+:H+ antiporter subunit C